MCVYMALMSRDPTGQGRKRWMMRWKPALNALGITLNSHLAAERK
jgi:putative transposase